MRCAQLRLFLLLALLSLPRAEARSRQAPAADCCDFKQWEAELNELFECGSAAAAERVYCFVHNVVLFNLKLSDRFAEFRSCVQFWAQANYDCREHCPCVSPAACCRSTAFSNFSSGFSTINSRTKKLIIFKGGTSLAEFKKSAFSVNMLRGHLEDVIKALKSRRSIKQETEIYTFSFVRVKAARRILNYTVLPGNDSMSIIDRMANYYRCNTKEMVIFYLDVYGVVLQQLLMHELYKELTRQSGESPYRWSHDLQVYIRLAKSMIRQVISCSTKEIRSIRTQEIKEKDMAMRNAGIVFSSFLLMLVAIIALMAALSCRKRDRGQKNITVRDEPAAVDTADSDNGDLLYKRYYETDETL